MDSDLRSPGDNELSFASFAREQVQSRLVRLARGQQSFCLPPEMKHEFTGWLGSRQRRGLARPGLHAMDIARLATRITHRRRKRSLHRIRCRRRRLGSSGGADIISRDRAAEASGKRPRRHCSFRLAHRTTPGWCGLRGSAERRCRSAPRWRPRSRLRRSPAHQRSSLQWTLSWREPDSNHRYRSYERVSRLLPNVDAGPIRWMGYRSSRETTVVGRGPLFPGRLFNGGTDGSNPSSSRRESAANLDRGRQRRPPAMPLGNGALGGILLICRPWASEVEPVGPWDVPQREAGDDREQSRFSAGTRRPETLSGDREFESIRHGIVTCRTAAASAPANSTFLAPFS
jgi:hypothetical protein